MKYIDSRSRKLTFTLLLRPEIAIYSNFWGTVPVVMFILPQHRNVWNWLEYNGTTKHEKM